MPLWSGELESPVLKIGDQIRIDELNAVFTVKKHTRTTSNKHLYLMEESIIIEDETTVETKKVAEAEKTEYDRKWLERIELIRARKESEEEPLDEICSKKSWLQKLFSR